MPSDAARRHDQGCRVTSPIPASDRSPLASPAVADQVTTTPWRDQLGDAQVLVSGFGKWGGGLYDLTTGAPEAIDDLATSGLSLGGGRLWRVLRAPGEQTSVCELMSYDARGVRSYQRLDAIRDPHDLCWHDGAIHVVSSWDGIVWRGGTRGGGGGGGALPPLPLGGFRGPKGWEGAPPPHPRRGGAPAPPHRRVRPRHR